MDGAFLETDSFDCEIYCGRIMIQQLNYVR